MSDIDFERRVATALRAPVPARAESRALIMQRVRTAARSGAPRRHGPSLSSRSARHSIVGLAMAASVGSIAVLGGVTSNAARAGGERSVVIGDSVVATLRDTLRLVRLFAMPDGDHRYAFVVDGARWAPDPSTVPVRDSGRLVSLLHVTKASN